MINIAHTFRLTVFSALCIFSFIFLSDAVNAKTTITDTGILLFHVTNPAQKFAYAGKMHWNHRENRWDRVIVIYNNAPDPDKNHPVSQYVKQLKNPSSQEKYQYNLHYKPFHLTANCDGRTPLSTKKTWRINFDKHALGTYKAASLRGDWNCPKWHMGNELLTVVDKPQAFRGHSLRLHFPKGSYSCRNNKHCINWKPKLGGEFHQVTYSYQLKLPKGFDFVKGGKLPGVAGGTANTGGRKPNGKDGWSVRMMWNRHGKLIQYVYHPDQPRQFGEIMEWDMKKLELGKWHTIKTTVRINVPGKRNGMIKSWLDGKLVLNKNDMRFRNTNKLLIDRFMFAVFFGGGDPSWAPRTDQHLFLDEFVISVK
ncbi:MAG: hypothetical protein L3J51_00400 [Cocleimonas sp.]|nr:hypothetical protein [Cocleimonas sp.]